MFTGIKKRLFGATLASAIIITSAQVAISAPLPPDAIQAGQINTNINRHDMDILKRKQFENKKLEDYEKLQKKNKKEKDEKKKDSSTLAPSNDTPVVKAKVSEYKTKGVYVDKYEISKSDILSEEELSEIFNPITRANVHFNEIDEAITKVNMLYSKKGFVTARAFLPPQEVNSGKIKIILVEGKIGDVKVQNNKWTKSGFIEKRMSLNEGDLFDIVTLEKDILKFNRYNQGVELNGSLVPGSVKGTTDIILNAKEDFPFHITGLFDNAGRNTIGVLRGGVMAQADSLFGQRDKLTLGAYMGKASVTPFADYNIPVNKYDGRVGFMYSASNSRIIDGPYTMFNIESRSHNYALYYTHPLIRKPTYELNAYTSLNYRVDTKRGICYAFQDFYHAFPICQEESRYFKYSGGVTRLHDFGHGIIGQFRGNYQYIPTDVVPYIDQFQSGGIASVRGFSEGVLVGKTGYFVSAEVLFPILPSSITVKVKEEKENKEEHVFNISTLENDMKHKNIKNLAVLDNQSSAFQEAVDTIPTPKTKKVPFLGKYVKGIVFVDHAGVFPFKGEGPGQEGIDANDFLASAGMGLRLQLPADLTARVYWGFPLINNSHEQFTGRANWGRFHFELSFAPNLEKIIEFSKKRIQAAESL